MRIWHKALIPVLPRRQLLAQWRECCCIARNIAVNGTPNHLLVNKAMDYPMSHFKRYTSLIAREMERRGYNCERDKFTKWYIGSNNEFVSYIELFSGWHNIRYLRQCYYNLEEKYDCGGILENEWLPIKEKFKRLTEGEGA